MATRAFTATLLNSDGSVGAGQILTIELLCGFVSATGIAVAQKWDETASLAGVVTTNLAVPDSGTAPYRFQREDGREVYAHLAAGGTIDLSTLEVVVGATVTQDAVITLLDLYQLKSATPLYDELREKTAGNGIDLYSPVALAKTNVNGGAIMLHGHLATNNFPGVSLWLDTTRMWDGPSLDVAGQNDVIAAEWINPTTEADRFTMKLGGYGEAWFGTPNSSLNTAWPAQFRIDAGQTTKPILWLQAGSDTFGSEIIKVPGSTNDIFWVEGDGTGGMGLGISSQALASELYLSLYHYAGAAREWRIQNTPTNHYFTVRDNTQAADRFIIDNAGTIQMGTLQIGALNGSNLYQIKAQNAQGFWFGNNGADGSEFGMSATGSQTAIFDLSTNLFTLTASKDMSLVAVRDLYVYSVKMGFFGATPVVKQTKAGHNNWAAISDIVSVLYAYGLVDSL